MATFQDNNGSHSQNSEQQENLGLADVSEENVGLEATENVTAGNDINNSGAIGGSSVLPVRANADDCAYYLKTGTCKFGLSCKYNHPVKKAKKVNNEKINEGLSEKTLQIECKYYLTAGGCKYGNSCKFIHAKSEPEIALPEFNCLGLPIRMGERECPFYMRNGTCGYGINCRFNHPDPTSYGAADFASSAFGGYSVGQVSYSSGKFQGEYAPFHSAELSYYSTVVSDVAGPYVGNTSSCVASTSSLPQGTAQICANQVADKKTMDPPGLAKTSMDEKQQVSCENGEKLPQRPGQPDCVFYMNRGTCILGSDCRFNHPKERSPQQTDIVYTEKGLPLKPGGIVCHVYEMHGLCKFGPTCLYDHPLVYDPKVPARVYEPPVPSVSRPMRSWYEEDEFGNFGEQQQLNGY